MAQKVIVDVNTKGAKTASNSLNKVDKSISNMAKSALTYGAAYFGARGIYSAFTTSIKLAGIQDFSFYL